MIFECLLKPSPKKKYIPPDMNGLVEDACSFLVGGSDTTGLTLQVVVCLVLRNPDALRRLREELNAASGFIRDDFDLQRVSKLPWLVQLPRSRSMIHANPYRLLSSANPCASTRQPQALCPAKYRRRESAWGGTSFPVGYVSPPFFSAGTI